MFSSFLTFRKLPNVDLIALSLGNSILQKGVYLVKHLYISDIFFYKFTFSPLARLNRNDFFPSSCHFWWHLQ